MQLKTQVASLLRALLNLVGARRLYRLAGLVHDLDPAWARALVEGLLSEDHPRRRYVNDGFLRFYLGQHREQRNAFMQLDVDERTQRLLTAIPTETSFGERCFLYHYFRDLWPGDHQVFEVGPFLGGTTRAIALGMAANRRAAPEARLLTADRFHSYYEPSELRRYIQPLVEGGVFTAEAADELTRTGDFQALFEAIHRGESYYPRLTILNGRLPDRRGEWTDGPRLLPLAPDLRFGTWFIDGCKSWIATKYLLSLTMPARHGSGEPVLIFQDYGVPTCFWIPLCAALLEPHIELAFAVNDTFTYRAAPSFAGIDPAQLIPDDPAELGSSRVCAIFDSLVERARDRGDYRGAVRLQLQRVAALLWMGDIAAARDAQRALHASPDVRGYEPVLRHYARNPTYRCAEEDGVFRTLHLPKE